MPPLTIQQLLLQARQKIDQGEAEMLIAHTLNKTREFVMAHPEIKIKRSKDKKINRLLARRANGEPIAYLTGHKKFFGLDFEVNNDVLIPRSDTEVLVETVLSQLSTLQLYNFTTCLIDVGTGSGCIPISIIKTLKHRDIKILATDISTKAIAVAKRNAKKHGVKIKFVHGDLLKPLIKSNSPKSISYNLIITANLPYLSEIQHKNSPTIKFEPKIALVAKNNGLALYEKLLKQIKKLLTLRTLQTLWTFIEIDPSQAKPIKLLIKRLLPDAKIEIKKDLSGLDRVVQITNYAA